MAAYSPFKLLQIRSVKRLILGVLCVALLPLLTGCYGNFPLTRTIYRVNGQIGRQVGQDQTQHNIAQSVVMWLLVIIPVYGVSMVIDALVFNLVEFWTGDVIQIGSVQDASGRTYSLLPDSGGRGAILTISRENEILYEANFVKMNDDRCDVRDSKGCLVGQVIKSDNGDFRLLDTKGSVIRQLPANELVGFDRIN